MKEKQLKTLLNFKKASTFGISLGIMIFLFGLFVNVYNRGYFLSTLGIGIIIASMTVFGFGMFLSLMEDYTVNSKSNVNTKAKVFAFIKK